MLNYSQYLTPFHIDTQLITNKMAGYFIQMGSPSTAANPQAYSMLSNLLGLETYMEAQNDVYRLTTFSLVLLVIPILLIRTPKKNKPAG